MSVRLYIYMTCKYVKNVTAMSVISQPPQCILEQWLYAQNRESICA